MRPRFKVERPRPDNPHKAESSARGTGKSPRTMGGGCELVRRLAPSSRLKGGGGKKFRYSTNCRVSAQPGGRMRWNGSPSAVIPGREHGSRTRNPSCSAAEPIMDSGFDAPHRPGVTGSGYATLSPPSFRGRATRGTRNPSCIVPRAIMDSGFAISSRPGMTEIC